MPALKYFSGVSAREAAFLGKAASLANLIKSNYLAFFIFLSYIERLR